MNKLNSLHKKSFILILIPGNALKLSFLNNNNFFIDSNAFGFLRKLSKLIFFFLILKTFALNSNL